MIDIPEGATHYIPYQTVPDVYYRQRGRELEYFDPKVGWCLSKHGPKILELHGIRIGPKKPIEFDYGLHPPMIPIERCPFCGGMASPDRDWRDAWVGCDNKECGVKGPRVPRKFIDQAIIKWNTRA